MQASKQKGAGGLLSVANRQSAAGSREMYVYRKRKKQTRTKRQKAGKVKKRPDRKRWEAEKDQGKERRRSTAWRTPAQRQEGFLRLTWFAFQSRRTRGKG